MISLKIFTVAVIHVVCGLFLYRARTLSPTWLTESDAIVFIFPAIGAFIAYLLVLFGDAQLGRAWGHRAVIIVFLALLATFASFWLMMFACLNLYGS